MKKILFLILISSKLFSQNIENIAFPGGYSITPGKFSNNGSFIFVSDWQPSFFRANDSTITNDLILPSDREIKNIETSQLDPLLVFANASNTLIMSTDGGINWKIIIADTSVNSSSMFKINPMNASVIYNLRNLNELWVSRDKGNSWNKLYTFSGSQFNSIDIAPADTSYIYCSTTDGIYLSTNSGMNFTKKSALFSGRIKVNPINKHSLFLSQNFLYKSTDEGENFTKIFDKNNIVDFSVAATDTNKIFTGTVQDVNMISVLYKTTDNGINWQPISVLNGEPVDYACTMVSIDLLNSNRIFVFIPDYGVFRSDDSGENFHPVSTSTVAPMDYDFINDKEFLITSGDWRILKTTDSGKSWFHPILPPREAFHVTGTLSLSFSPDNKNIGVAGVSESYNALRTTDSGNSWQTIPVSGHMAYFHPNKKGMVFLTGEPTSKSTDYGVTWTEIPNSDFSRLAFDNNNENIMYAIGRYDLYAYKSTDYGETWDSVYYNGSNWSDINTDINSNIYLSSRFDGIILKSTDNGSTWNDMGSALKSIDKKLRIETTWTDPAKPGRIYAGLAYYGVPFSNDIGGGLYLTENYGQSWRKVFGTSVTRFIKKNGDYIYFDTPFGLKRFVDTLTVTSINENYSSSVPDGFELLQNYPNPFNPVTVIKYNLPKDNYVSISVFNSLGQLVKTVAGEFQKAGEHQFEFNGSNLSSGVYFYRLQAGGFSDVKKMIILK